MTSYTYDYVREQLEKNGASILTKEKNYKPVSKTKIEWKCGCGNIGFTQVSSVSKNPRCRSCSIKLSKGNVITYENFVSLLEEEGWKMVTNKKDYKNTKTIMQTVCNNGHETSTTYARWKNKHRCKFCLFETEKLTIDDAKKEFENYGFELLEKKYVNNKTPMKYRCKCGEISEKSLQNLRKYNTGCNSCIQKRKKVSWQEIWDYFEENGCILLIEEDEYKNNVTPMPFICYCGDNSQISWKLFKKGTRCPNHTLEKRIETTEKKYGVENVFQSEQIKQKSKQTMIDRYGVDHNMKTKQCIEKAKRTNKKNNGGIHNLKDKKIRRMAKEAHIRLYGYPPSPVCEQSKKTMVEKYGVEHNTQNSVLFEKMRKRMFRLKTYEFPSGKKVQLQGYESFAIDMILNEWNINEDDIEINSKFIPEVWYLDTNEKKRRYYPDIYIKSMNALVEVKSKYTLECNYENNIKKFQAASQEHKFIVLVFDKKGNLIEDIVFSNPEVVIIKSDQSCSN